MDAIKQISHTTHLTASKTDTGQTYQKLIPEVKVLLLLTQIKLKQFNPHVTTGFQNDKCIL